MTIPADTTPTDIGMALRAARRDAGSSLADLADESGISGSRLSRMEHGAVAPTILDWVVLCGCLPTLGEHLRRCVRWRQLEAAGQLRLALGAD